MKLKMSDIIEVIIGHTFRKAIANDEKGNFSIVQAKNISANGRLSQDFTKTRLEKTRTKAFIQKWDVFLTNRGTFRSATYEGKSQNLIASSSIFILRINDLGKVLPEYLVIYLNSKLGQANLESKNRGATIKSLPKNSLLELEIQIPSIEVQKNIIAINKNHQKRAELYKYYADLNKAVASATITSLITT